MTFRCKSWLFRPSQGACKLLKLLERPREEHSTRYILTVSCVRFVTVGQVLYRSTELLSSSPGLYKQMLTPRNLNMATRSVPDGTIQEWMWQGASIESALCSNALTGLCCPAHILACMLGSQLILLSPVTGLVSVDDGALPAYPETQEQAHARASKALEVKKQLPSCCFAYTALARSMTDSLDLHRT